MSRLSGHQRQSELASLRAHPLLCDLAAWPRRDGANTDIGIPISEHNQRLTNAGSTDMAMKRIKDVAVKVGSYTDRNGATKGKWKNVGSLVQFDDGGQGLMLDTTFNPAGVPNPEGRDSILLSFFDIKTDGAAASGGGNSGGRPRAAAPEPAPGDDEIPF